MKKFFSLLLCLIFIFQIAVQASAQFNAPELTREEWDKIYSSNYPYNNLPTLNVGADETSISLCWHSPSDKATPEVRFSKNSDMSDYTLFKGICSDSLNDNQLVCRVTITDLKENTSYFYQWNTGDGWSNIYEYETKSFGSHKAIVVGDIQIAEDYRTEGLSQSDIGFTWNNVLAEALEKNPDISYLVSPGDNTSTGETDAEWHTLLTPEALRGLPMALAIGNHDKKGMKYNDYTNMPNEYYGRFFSGLDRDFWFRYGDVLYLVFDSTSGNAPDHMAFAREAVKLNKDAKWRIGVVHHGIYGAGDSIGDLETEILLSSIFTPIFETYDLDLVITGHTHSQGRSHFMENRKIVSYAESGKTYKNPEGIVYLNSNSVCEKVVMDYEAEHLAYSFMENDVTTYTTLEFNGNNLELKTFRGDNSLLLDSLTIEKDIVQNDDAPEKTFKKVLYKGVEFLGFIYTMIDNLIKKIG